MNSELIIRRASVDDIKTVALFNINMAYETENITLLPSVVEAGVKNLITNEHHGFYLVAEMDRKVVGSLMITTEWSDWRNGVLWWVQSVYVEEEYRRQGIYSRLYTFVKELAQKEVTVCGFRLYVEKENLIAQQTYKKLGMKEKDYLFYEELQEGIVFTKGKI